MDYTLHLNPADILDGIGYNPNHSAHEEGTQTTTYSEALTGGIVVTRTSLLTGEDNTQFVEGITEEDLSNYDRHSITIGGISEDDKQFIDTGITMAELVDAFNDIEGTQGVNHGR
tara:strand:+ start:814 stop:1158 length:345 start_codon:yes stop_codon:yes gene_type:complete